jgi:hypothetical protein
MVLDLFEGCELVINGESWRVERLEPYWGKVALRPGGDPVDQRATDQRPATGHPYLPIGDADGSSRTHQRPTTDTRSCRCHRVTADAAVTVRHGSAGGCVHDFAEKRIPTFR